MYNKIYLDAYVAKEAGALSYYTKALAHAGKLGKNGRKLGMRGLKKLSFNEKRDLLKALKNNVLQSTSMPGSHQNNPLLRDLRGAVKDYYEPFASSKIAPPDNTADFWIRQDYLAKKTDRRIPWAPSGANYWVNQYNAPFLQGVKQQSPASFSIN